MVAVLPQSVLTLRAVSLTLKLGAAVRGEILTATFVVALARGRFGALTGRGGALRRVKRGRDGSPLPARGNEPARSEITVTLRVRVCEVGASARANGTRVGTRTPA